MAKLLKGSTGAPPAVKGDEMPFLDHLEELRRTVIKCVLVLFLFAVLMGFFAFDINAILMWPFDAAVANLGQHIDRPRTASPFAPFMVYFQIIIFGSLFLSLPFILYFLAQFVLPALTRRERGVLIPGVVAAAVLFVSGALMAFFVLMPIMLGVSFRLSEALEISVLYDASRYYSTVTLLTLGVGVSFELPLLVVILIYVGILKPAFLRKYRRHIFVLLVVFSAVVTPPDPVTLLLMAGPLYLLYELAVFVGEKLLKRKLAHEDVEDGDEDGGEYDPDEDPRYKDRDYKRIEDNPEDSYYMSYEEERKYYPEPEYGAGEGTQPAADTQALTDAAENEAGAAPLEPREPGSPSDGGTGAPDETNPEKGK